jgi:hypothetical protein
MDFQEWGDFVDLLRGLSEQPVNSKQDAQLISPAIYEVGTTRSNRNVVEWGKWAAVDVDDYKGWIHDILDRFKSTNSVVYSTASSTTEQPKFRIVFDLDRRVNNEELRHFWYALNRFLGELGDPQTKDSSRMYYIPGDYKSSNSFFHATSGDPLVVDGLLRSYPYAPPSGNGFLDNLSPEMKLKVLEHRRGKLEQTDITWRGYHDCPFVPNKMVEEYKSISETGWYSQMYRIMIAIASNAIKSKYPITASQISLLCKEIDAETGNWYENRPLEREAGGALNWAYANIFEEC